MKILFCSVVYDKISIKFLEEFVCSLYMQTYKNFDILIVNDNYKGRLNIFEKLGNINIIDLSSCNYNPSQIRNYILEYVIKSDYDILIWGDIDDIFSSNRVEEILNTYKKDVAFYYNDLVIKNTNKDFFCGKLKENVSHNDLDDFNFIGLSNSALNINLLRKYDFKINCDLDNCIAFDWLLYTLLLKQNFKGIKVNSTKTYYRIHNDNIVGLTNKLNKKNLFIGLEVKTFQYKVLSEYDVIFKNKLKNIIQLSEKLKSNDYIDKYIEYVNTNYYQNTFWWQNIIIDNLEDLLYEI